MASAPNRLFVTSAALGGMLAVALGAIGAHALKGQIDSYYLGVFETAVKYQMYHSLALFSMSLYVLSRPARFSLPRTFGVAQWGMLLGTVIFSGSLYMLVWTQTKLWGAVTPLGGVVLVIAWCAAAIAGYQVAGNMPHKSDVEVKS